MSAGVISCRICDFFPSSAIRSVYESPDDERGWSWPCGLVRDGIEAQRDLRRPERLHVGVRTNRAAPRTLVIAFLSEGEAESLERVFSTCRVGVSLCIAGGETLTRALARASDHCTFAAERLRPSQPGGFRAAAAAPTSKECKSTTRAKGRMATSITVSTDDPARRAKRRRRPSQACAIWQSVCFCIERA